MIKDKITQKIENNEWVATHRDTVLSLIAENKEKLELLQEWQSCNTPSIELANQNKFEESDKLDDRCIEIETYLESNYNIEFDYGEIIDDKNLTVNELISHIEAKLELLNAWIATNNAWQELADGDALDSTDGKFIDKEYERIEEELEVEYGIQLP